MPRCPNCWSSVDTVVGPCPHCGQPLRVAAGQRGARWLGVAIAVAVAGLAAAWWSTRANVATEQSGDSDPGVASETDAADDPAPADRTEPAAHDTAATLVHWALRSESGEPILALALRSASGVRWCVPLADLPAEGGFVAAGAPVPATVVTADVTRGLALLRLDGAPPEGIEPLGLARVDAPEPGLELRARPWELADRTAIWQRRLPDGSWWLSGDIPRASAILEANGRAVAYALDDGVALPLAPITAWLDHPGGEPLAELQGRLRRSDPFALRDDALALLRGPHEVAPLRRAVELLREASERARDADLHAALAVERPLAHRALLRALAEHDPAAAIAEGRSARAEFASDAGLIFEWVALCSAHGDAFEAADAFLALRAMSPDHARQVADAVAEAFLRAARRLAADGRTAEAIRHLAAAVDLFPLRADLHAKLAEQLARAGRSDEALARAREAARLDPTHAALVASLETSLDGSEPGAIEIPFDPETHVVRAAANVAGVALEFVVDTGASMTTIPSAVADRLGLRNPGNPRVQVQTASGIAEGEVVRLPQVQLGALRLRGLEAVVLDLPNTLSQKGLLGMNALRRWRVQIDGERGVLRLEQRRPGGRR